MMTTKRNTGKPARVATAHGAKDKPDGTSKVVRMHSPASGRNIAVSRESHPDNPRDFEGMAAGIGDIGG